MRKCEQGMTWLMAVLLLGLFTVDTVSISQYNTAITNDDISKIQLWNIVMRVIFLSMRRRVYIGIHSTAVDTTEAEGVARLSLTRYLKEAQYIKGLLPHKDPLQPSTILWVSLSIIVFSSLEPRLEFLKYGLLHYACKMSITTKTIATHNPTSSITSINSGRERFVMKKSYSIEVRLSYKWF